MEFKTIGELYGPAVEAKTQEEADALFKGLVEYCMSRNSELNLESAAALVRTNLGYYSGYYDNDTVKRVQRLYICTHPVFGDY